MALETPIASFDFNSGSQRGTQLSLYGARLLHHGIGQMDSMALSAIAAVRVGYERNLRRIGWGAGLVPHGWSAFFRRRPAVPLRAPAAHTANKTETHAAKVKPRKPRSKKPKT